jgi:uncharacterized damage-inducible protein DinB
MNELLQDLIAHQEWADAEHWRALETHPGALKDDVIVKRLYHFHFTQWAFLKIIRGEELIFPRREELPDLPTFKQIVIRNYADVTALLKNATEVELHRTLTVPWFNNPPLNITVAQALAQVAMHSQYHRGQNAARLREIGGQPPLTDLIAWYWKGRPAAAWR